MLFIAQKPTHLLITSTQHILITTSSQIIFTSLHFIEEYLYQTLHAVRPISIQYSTQSSQAAILSTNSISIYWTDWHHKVSLRLYLSLYNEKVYSLEWMQGWHCYGQFKQYSPKKLKLWNIDNVYEERQSCFLGHIQYFKGEQNIIQFDFLSLQKHSIQWQDFAEVKKAVWDENLEMKAFKLKQDIVLIQMSNILLYIKDQTVQRVIEHDGTLTISDNVAIWVINDKIIAYTMQEQQIICHGQCEGFEGVYYGAVLKKDAIMLLFYEFKELKVKLIHLVNEEDNLKFTQEQEKKKYNKLIKIPTLETFKIRDIQHNPHYHHQIHSAATIFQGNNIKEALKASIGKFKKEFEKSLEEEKFRLRESETTQQLSSQYATKKNKKELNQDQEEQNWDRNEPQLRKQISLI